MGIHRVFGKVFSSDFESVRERPLFGGSIGDGDGHNQTTSETFLPPSQSQQEQTEGDNITGSEGNRAPTQKTQDQIWYEQHEGQFFLA